MKLKRFEKIDSLIVMFVSLVAVTTIIIHLIGLYDFSAVYNYQIARHLLFISVIVASLFLVLPSLLIQKTFKIVPILKGFCTIYTCLLAIMIIGAYSSFKIASVFGLFLLIYFLFKTVTEMIVSIKEVFSNR
ncbi:hypothetical protein M3596_21405 [Bacillus subtilis]|uniref:hypothetical protein n=1 Tax=Bacillus subtilis TaxID=1423 RepID=UPI0020420A6C|nr:hypothetical protein [Bacillus subtilis]MCM3191274.1 hypothetical protein [Bacillus subtilis]